MSEFKSSLLERTRTLLCQSKLSLETIAHNVNTINPDYGIRYDWLVRLKSGTTDSPGVVRVQAVYEYLSGTKLNLDQTNA